MTSTRIIAAGPGEEGLLAGLREALAGLDVVGVLSREGASVCLAQERATGAVLALTVEADPSVEFGYVVGDSRRADGDLPEIRSDCPGCSIPLREWTRYCLRCGHALGGVALFRSRSRSELAQILRDAAEGRYTVIGEVDASGVEGGLCFLARDLESGEMAGLRLVEGPIPHHTRLHGDRRQHPRSPVGDRRRGDRRQKSLPPPVEQRDGSAPELVVSRGGLTHLAEAPEG